MGTYKGHNMITGTYREFIVATEAALARYRAGQATINDITQIGYACEQGRNMVSQYSYPGYTVTYEREMSLMGECEGVVEDAHNDAEQEGKENPFEGWKYPRRW